MVLSEPMANIAKKYGPSDHGTAKLYHADKKIIIDTKFYKKTLNVNYRFG